MITSEGKVMCHVVQEAQSQVQFLQRLDTFSYK